MYTNIEIWSNVYSKFQWLYKYAAVWNNFEVDQFFLSDSHIWQF